MSPRRAPERHWLLWDGECALCGRFARWVERNDRRQALRVLAYQDAPAPPMTPALRAACARAVHVVCDDGRVLKGGAACVFVFGTLGWRRAAAVLAIPPLSWAVEGCYQLVARNRSLVAHLLPGKDG